MSIQDVLAPERLNLFRSRVSAALDGTGPWATFIDADALHAFIASLERNERLGVALEDLLKWAERYRGGDKTLNSEEWYIVSEFARKVLAEDAA